MPTAKQHNFDAFISHSSRDRAEAELLVEGLEKRGLKCWIAPRDLAPAAEYPSEIMRGIRESRSLIVLLSKDSVDSPSVRREIERAADYGHLVIPLAIEEVKLKHGLDFFLSLTQRVDLYDGPRESHLDRIAEIITTGKASAAVHRRRRVVPRWVMMTGAAVAFAITFWILSLGLSAWQMRKAQEQAEQMLEDLPAQLEQVRASTNAALRGDFPEDDELEISRRRNQMRIEIPRSFGSFRPSKVHYSLDGQSFEDFGSRLVLPRRPMSRLVLRLFSRDGQEQRDYDKTDDFFAALPDIVKASVTDARGKWGCSIHGCRFDTTAAQGVVCAPYVEQVHLGTSRDSFDFEVDRDGCYGENANDYRVCYDFPDLPFRLGADRPLFARIALRNGGSVIVNLPIDTETGIGGIGNVDVSSLAQLELIPERTSDANAPDARLLYRPTGPTVGGFVIALPQRQCRGQGTRVQHSWLIDTDGGGFINVRSRMSLAYSETPKAGQIGPSTQAIGVLLESGDGRSAGPYWYRFDPVEAVNLAAASAGRPDVECKQSRRRGGGMLCYPVAQIAWLEVSKLEFGPSAESLNESRVIDFDVAELLAAAPP